MGFDAQAAQQLAAKHNDERVAQALRIYGERKTHAAVTNPLGYFRHLLTKLEEAEA